MKIFSWEPTAFLNGKALKAIKDLVTSKWSLAFDTKFDVNKIPRIHQFEPPDFFKLLSSMISMFKNFS